jgi:adenylate cyclase
MFSRLSARARFKGFGAGVRRSALYWLPLAVLVVAAFARLALPDVLGRLSLIWLDLYQRAAPRAASDLPLRIVAIDDQSLNQIGQWPWPRGIVAQLVDKMRDAGAAVVVFDILFAEPDRTSPQSLLPILTAAGVAETEAKQLLTAMPDPDQRLGEAMAKLPVVIGFALTDAGGGTAPPITKAGFAFAGAAGADPLSRVERFPQAISDVPALQQTAAGNGFVNSHLDWDNVARREPLLLRLGDKAVPSLPAEAVRVAVGARGYIVRTAGANTERGFGQNSNINAIKIGPLDVPTDAAGMVWLHYAPLDPARYLSAADILAGNFDPARIAGHIVLVGATAAALGDVHATPLAADIPGIEIHAQLIEQLLQGGLLTRPDWAIGGEILFTLFVGGVLILGIPRIGALASAGVGGVAVITALAISWFAFRDAQLLVDPVNPIAVLTTVYLLTTLLSYRQTERRQREIRRAFSRYMSPHYVEQLARHPEKLVLGGEIRLLTIMFCDIRGFTSLSEGLSAHELTQLVNNFLSPMTEIITAHQGTIDKFIGDCIMAFWNAPLDDPDHARNAVAAAQAMRRRLDELNRSWAAAGEHTLHVGIGINTGECCVGNFGSQQRFDYSLLGDPVNLTSRLEGLTKLYGVDLIIGEATAARLDMPGLIELDLVAVKGKTQAVRIYTLPPEPVEAGQYLARHSALLAAYRQCDWAAARRLLEDEVLAAVRDMAPFYDLFRRRIARLQIESPPPGWDGVFVAEEK